MSKNKKKLSRADKKTIRRTEMKQCARARRREHGQKRRDWIEANRKPKAGLTARRHQQSTEQDAAIRASLQRPRTGLAVLDAFCAGTLRTPPPCRWRRKTPTENLAEAVQQIAATAPAPEAMARFRALVAVVQQKMPRTLSAGRLGLLWAVSQAEHVRPLSGWAPARRSQPQRLRALIRHLLLAYPVPRFFLEELMSLSDTHTALSAPQRTMLGRRLALMRSLGNGGSVKLAQQQGRLPGTLTRRMRHLLMVDRTAPDLVGAVRAAQIVGLGGHRGLVEAVYGTFLGNQFQEEEPFWLRALQWLINHPLPGRLVGPMLDYIRAQRSLSLAEGRAWALKGRTRSSMLRGMAQWHRMLGGTINVPYELFQRSGLAAGEIPVKRGAGTDVWTITEIPSTHALALEGRQMSHCVYSYAARIRRGASSIWSLQCNKTRLLTIEVDPHRREIVQVRGKANRAARRQEKEIILRWAAQNGLRYRHGQI